MAVDGLAVALECPQNRVQIATKSTSSPRRPPRRRYSLLGGLTTIVSTPNSTRPVWRYLGTKTSGLLTYRYPFLGADIDFGAGGGGEVDSIYWRIVVIYALGLTVALFIFIVLGLGSAWRGMASGLHKLTNNPRPTVTPQ